MLPFDELVAPFIVVVALVIGVVVLVTVLGALFRNRCPQCGAFLGRTENATKTATADTVDVGYDHNLEQFTNMSRRHTGYLVTRRCRKCDATWERLEST